MKKKYIYLFIYILIICTFLTGCSNNVQPSDMSYSNQKSNINMSISSSPPSEPIIVSTFSTKIYDKSEGRMNNLEKASKDLSRLIINPGETFSFNENMGPYSKERGYQKGKIFDGDGDVMQEYGGGICQISSTLYNAVLQLDFEIIERNNHSNKVQYIELGKDATVSYGNLDFVFKNNKDYSIKLDCRVENEQLIVDIYKI